jgi:hypothetical protein
LTAESDSDEISLVEVQFNDTVSFTNLFEDIKRIKSELKNTQAKLDSMEGENTKRRIQNELSEIVAMVYLCIAPLIVFGSQTFVVHSDVAREVQMLKNMKRFAEFDQLDQAILQAFSDFIGLERVESDVLYDRLFEFKSERNEFLHTKPTDLVKLETDIDDYSLSIVDATLRADFVKAFKVSAAKAIGHHAISNT